MTTYSIKVLKDGRTLTRKQITKGLVKTEGVIIRAGADQAYVLSDALLEDKAPTKIKTRRVGQDLHVALGDSSIEVPDLIIEQYFAFPPAPLLGTLSDGTNVTYDMTQIVGMAQTDAEVQGAETSESHNVSTTFESSLVDPHPYAGMSGMQLAGAVGLGAVLLSSAGRSGGNESVAPTAAESAQTKISIFAGDNGQAAPVVSDYTALGVSGVSATNLLAINSAVDALSASDVSNAGKIQFIVDAYTKILAEANGPTADATPGNNATAALYSAIGVNLGAASTATENLSLLNSVIGEKTTADVDTIAEIDALVEAVNAVMTGAAGGVAPSLSQLTLLNVVGVTSDNLPLVQAAIAETLDSGTGLDTLAKLQAVVDAKIGVTNLSNYAGGNTTGAPTLADYTQATVMGVTATNLSAINSAVDALDAPDVSTVAKLQVVVDAYSKILAEANGTVVDATPTSNPLASDYASIGADIGMAKTNTYALSLLDDVVGGLNTTAVDTIAEINGLAQVVDKIMNTADGSVASLTVTDFNTIGVATAGPGAVNSINLTAVIDAIANAGGQSHIGGLVELQTLVTAVATIVSYADANTHVAPTLTTYANAGLIGVTSVNLGAINSAIDANVPTGVDTKAEMQTLIDAYTFILAEANGTTVDATPTVNPTLAQYAAIGANIGTAATDTESFNLLNDSIANLSTTSVDTVSEINGLAATSDKIMNLASLVTGTAIPTGVPSMAELTALGLNTTLANTAVEQNAIWQAIIDSPNTGTGVMTILQLQALINANAS